MKPNAKYDWSLYDKKIRDTYRIGRRGAVKALAFELNIPITSISYRARSIGLKTYPSSKMYVLEEDNLLIKNCDLPSAILVKKLANAGFHRCQKSIINRLAVLRKNGKIPDIAERLEDKDLFLVDDIATQMGVSGMTVNRWINFGLLKTSAKHTPEIERQRRFLIKRRDLKAFLVEHRAHWKPSKCTDHFLFEMFVFNR